MFTILMLAADDPAAAGGHGVEHPELIQVSNWLPSVTALVVFLVALIVLWKTVWPKITQGLDDRENKILEEIASAEEAREQAKGALEEYQNELASAREEASRMIQEARADARRVADELRTRNEAELTEMRQRATADIESAKRSAISELHSEAAGLAAAIASKILQKEISAEDQQRLVDESLQELAGMRS